MQLRLLIALLIFAQVRIAMGQNASAIAENDSAKIQLDDIEVNFLSSYYVQDGDLSAVTGGIGTEYLTNFAPSVNITLPTDTHKVWNIDVGVDFYSSASTDNIDNQLLLEGYRTGASGQDERTYFTFTRKTKAKKTLDYSYRFGGSFEWDVFSYYGGGSVGLTSKDNNQGLDLKLTYYYDDWKLIYPVEFRNGAVEFLKEDVRQTINTQLVFFRNLTRKLNASVAADFVVQSGLLSTPFHRVYFQESNASFIEMLPDSRVKTPVGLRLNYHVLDFLILKSFYRYYRDSWGLDAQTFELTVPIKIGQSVRLYPFYRKLIQNEADYFAPYKEHELGAEFYTSDWDLGTFDADKYGMGISFTPLFGLSRFKWSKGRAGLLKTISLRYARYERTNGLTADVVTMGVLFNLKQ